MNTGMRILGSMKAFASHIGVEGEVCNYVLDSNYYDVKYSKWMDCVVVAYAHHSDAYCYLTNWQYLPSNNELILAAWGAWGGEAKFIHDLFAPNFKYRK